jgi:hypothetical protein
MIRDVPVRDADFAQIISYSKQIARGFGTDRKWSGFQDVFDESVIYSAESTKIMRHLTIATS